MKLYEHWLWYRLKHLKQPGSQGFTLVELLVVLVIAGVLAMISVPAAINLNRRIRLSTAQSEILRAARTAQSNARRFGERWQVVVFQPDATNGPVITAAFPGGEGTTDNLFNANPNDPTAFFARCAQIRKTCIRTVLDPIVRLDDTGSNFANDCATQFSVPMCRRISFGSDGGDDNSNVNARFQIRDVNDPGSNFALCVRTSSRLGVIRLEC